MVRPIKKTDVDFRSCSSSFERKHKLPWRFAMCRQKHAAVRLCSESKFLSDGEVSQINLVDIAVAIFSNDTHVFKWYLFIPRNSRYPNNL